MSSKDGVEAGSIAQKSGEKDLATRKLDQASTHRKFCIADSARLPHAKYYERVSITYVAGMTVVSWLKYH